MKTIFLVLCLVAACSARPQLTIAQPVSLQRTQYLDDAGQFSLSYHNSNGHSVEDYGSLKPTNDGTDHVLARTGSYRYVSPEGIPISVSFIADEYGYRAVGGGIP